MEARRIFVDDMCLLESIHPFSSTEILNREKQMPSAVQNIDDLIAGNLVLVALAKCRGIAAMTSKFIGKDKAAFDVIVEECHDPSVGKKYKCFTYYTVKTGKSKSAFSALGGLVLKDIVSKIFDHVVGQHSTVYSTSGDLSGGLGVGKIDTAGIYSTAAKIGGQMQLHAAKKMGKKTYDQVRVLGLGANLLSGGAVRFEEVKYAQCKGLNIVVRDWNGRDSHYWVDEFRGQGRSGKSAAHWFKRLHTMGGHHRCDYIYNPATGDLWE